MTGKIAIFSFCALLLMTEVTYAQTELYGDFSVSPHKYIYGVTGPTPGYLTPRCSCDINDAANCPSPFYSDTDQGNPCYDQIYSSGNWSMVFARSNPNPIFSVGTDGLVDINGDLNIPGTGRGIILRATDGMNCFRVTVNNSGTLQTTLVTCP